MPNAEPKPTLIYPFEAPPEKGQAIEILPGLHWIRLPMPGALDHINVWALDDGDGWALVDTGFRSDATTAAWRGLFAASPDRRSVSRVLVTHMHPDHIGMAGWLTRKFACRLWITRLEYLSCRVLMSDTGREAPSEAEAFYRAAGWGEAALETYRTRFGDYGKHIYTLPDSIRRMVDGETLRIGDHDWQVVVGSGHSPEHACLHCPALKVLISGDQVLPRISSNVSVYASEPDADPLAEWLASLDKLRREVPDDVLVLPAHGECFRGLHARLAYLAQGQHRTLDRLRRALQSPCRVVDLFSALFARSISDTDHFLLGLATGETLACLNHLCHAGEVTRQRDAQGVDWYALSV